MLCDSDPKRRSERFSKRRCVDFALLHGDRQVLIGCGRNSSDGLQKRAGAIKLRWVWTRQKSAKRQRQLAASEETKEVEEVVEEEVREMCRAVVLRKGKKPSELGHPEWIAPVVVKTILV